jgi:hypothetical protein
MVAVVVAGDITAEEHRLMVTVWEAQAVAAMGKFIREVPIPQQEQ